MLSLILIKFFMHFNKYVLSIVFDVGFVLIKIERVTL